MYEGEREDLLVQKWVLSEEQIALLNLFLYEYRYIVGEYIYVLFCKNKNDKKEEKKLNRPKNEYKFYIRGLTRINYCLSCCT